MRVVPVPTDPLGMGIAEFLLAPVAVVPVAVELAVLKSMAAYSALFSGSSISMEGTPPQLWFPPPG